MCYIIDNSRNNQQVDKNYQNPHKLQKTDENQEGRPVENNVNDPSKFQGNHQTYPGAPVGGQTNASGIQQNHNQAPQSTSIVTGESAKHGTYNDGQYNQPAMPSGRFHAPQGHENAKESENKENESDDAYSDDPKSRTSASSRVNFSKLTAEEKERRCHNMSKEVKQLRRKIRNMEERLARSSSCTEYRTGDYQGEGHADSLLRQAKEKLKSYKGYELSDQKDLLENLCTMIIQDRLKPDSLAYYMICTIVRGFLTPEEQAKYDQNQEENNDKGEGDPNLENKEILISLPEKEVRISKKEFQFYAPYHDNEHIMRLLTGQLSENSQIPGSGNTNPQGPPKAYNEQISALSKAMGQDGQNSQNFGALQGMQNLMNNQSMSNVGGNTQNPSNQNANNMMGQMLGGSGSQGQNSMYGMSSNMQNQMSPSQNSQLLNNLMSMQSSNPGMQWNMSQMAGMNPQNFANLDKQTINEMIANQMMNYNNPYMSQESANQGMNMGSQNMQYPNQNQGK